MGIKIIFIKSVIKGYFYTIKYGFPPEFGALNSYMKLLECHFLFKEKFSLSSQLQKANPINSDIDKYLHISKSNNHPTNKKPHECVCRNLSFCPSIR